MKLEYLADGSADCPLLRLFEFSRAEIRRLRDACQQLANRESHAWALHVQPWVAPVGGCEFTWRLSSRDEPVRTLEDGRTFELAQSAEAWLEMSDLLAPFMDSVAGYQWLVQGSGVNVLISHDGKW